MKILFITSWYPHPDNTNSGVFIRDQAELLSANHEVVVVFSNVRYSEFALAKHTVETSDYKNIREHRIFVARSILLFNQFHHLYVVARYVLKLAGKFRPDVVHVSVSYPSAFFASLVKYFLRVPFFVIEHTRISNHFRSTLHRWITYRSLKYADMLFGVSRRLASEMQTWTARKVGVIANVVDTERFSIAPFPDGIPQIGFLGALNTPVKGLDILLEALALVKSDFVLHIGGRGPMLDQYKVLAESLNLSSKCIFYGFVAHGEVPQFMNQLSFFVSASRYETFGIVIAEALSCGLPVVVTRSGGPEDFVNRKNGLTVPTENATELANAIEMMCDNYRSYDRIALADDIKNVCSKQVVLQQLQNACLLTTSARHLTT